MQTRFQNRTAGSDTARKVVMKKSVRPRPVLGSAQKVHVPIGTGWREGELHLPVNACGLVIFVQGSGGSRHSAANQFVERVVREGGCGTLLFDLLTRKEEIEDDITARLRFDVDLLAERLVRVTDWLGQHADLCRYPIGYFGSSTGGAASLVAAAALGKRIGAVVSRGGWPNLAGDALPRVEAPTLLIVGENDNVLIQLNKAALRALHCERQLKIVPGAPHLFDEPRALEQMARLASDWFSEHLRIRALTKD
jgi:putative phosphoribosyl transferase